MRIIAAAGKIHIAAVQTGPHYGGTACELSVVDPCPYDMLATRFARLLRMGRTCHKCITRRLLTSTIVTAT